MSTIVVGGGIVGLSIGWRVAQGGAEVTVVDPSPASAASFAAAGMLTPVSEVHYGEEALLALSQASYARWPAFAAELAEASGQEVPLRAEGSVAVGFDHDDLRALDELRRFQEELGLGVERLRSRDCRALEPMLSQRIRGGIRVDNEANVDNRACCRALLVALERAGGRLLTASVEEVLVERGRVIGVRLASGAPLHSEHVVVAAGAWSAALRGLPRAVVPPVRPVKGQIVRLRFDPSDPPLTRNVRALARGRPIYLVPRASGELVVGATVEEKGFDITVTAGGLHELLTAAIDVVPTVRELEQTEVIARLRPATPDNAPVIGPTALDGLLLATGHHRNGVLLTPVTADAIAALVLQQPPVPEASTFGIERFAR